MLKFSLIVVYTGGLPVLSLSDGKPTVQQSLSVVAIVSRETFWLASAKESFVHTIILFLCVIDSVSRCFEMYSNGAAVFYL